MGLTRPEVAWSVESEEDGGFTVFTGQLNLNLWKHATGIARFNNSGNVVWERNLEIDTLDIYTGVHNSSHKLNGEYGYVLGTAFIYDGANYMYLIRYSSTGDTLWTRHWSSDFGNDEIGYSAIEDPNGNFLIAGVSDNANQYSIGVVAKTDPDGNTLWKRYYTGYTGSTSSTIFGSIDNAFGGGYIVGSGTRSCDTCPLQHHVVRLDEDGNVVWQNYLVNNSDDSGPKIMHYGDGTYFGGTDRCLDPQGYYECKPQIIKYSESGDTLWTRAYGEDWMFRSYFTVLKRLSDGNLFTGGQIEDENIQKGFIAKVDTSGTMLWQRIYTNVDGNACRFNDFTELTTGELVAVGVAWPQGGDEPLGQDTWILKTDEYGCLIPGCHVSVEELERQEQSFLVGPNPASDRLNIFLPGEVTRTHHTQFRLTDLTGKLIREFSADTGSTTYMLDVSEYPTGVYLVSLVIDGQSIKTERVVVE
ncbi:MAG: T9SS type A sorting domain-containing protein [Flavobacteriales bacterium]